MRLLFALSLAIAPAAAAAETVAITAAHMIDVVAGMCACSGPP